MMLGTNTTRSVSDGSRCVTPTPMLGTNSTRSVSDGSRCVGTALIALLAFSCSPDAAGPGDVREDRAADIYADAEDTLVPDASPDLPDISETRPPDVSALIEEGKYWLANGEPGLAFLLFEDALEKAPDNQDARFGAGLSKYVHSAEFLAMLMTLPSQFAGYVSGPGTAARPQNENDYLAEQIHVIFKSLRDDFLVADQHLAQVTDNGLAWEIEQVPIYVLTRPVVNFKGRFDIADVFLLRSSSAFFMWSMELLAAQDFRTDMLTAVYGAMAMRDKGIEIWDVLSLAAQLMAADDRFLRLREEDGEALFLDGAQHMKDAGRFLLAGIELLQDREEDGALEAISLTWNEGTPVVVINNRVDFDTGVESPADFEFPPELKNAYDDLLEALDMPGQATRFSDGPAVQLGTLLGFAARLGVLRFLPVEIPIDLSGLGPAQATVLISVFFGNSLAFDYGRLLQNPVGLRAFLPLLAKVPDAAAAADFWLEWECPGETAATGFPTEAKGFICSKAADLADAPHFTGTAYELPADGFPSPLPYMVWEDPTWGSLLLVDRLYQENMGDPADFVPPDLALVNLGVHLWLEPVLGLLR